MLLCVWCVGIEVKDISSLTKDVKKSVKQPVKGNWLLYSDPNTNCYLIHKRVLSKFHNMMAASVCPKCPPPTHRHTHTRTVAIVQNNRVDNQHCVSL